PHRPDGRMSWVIDLLLGLGGISFLALVVLLVALRITTRYCLHTGARMDDPEFLPTLEGLTNSSSRSVSQFQLLSDVRESYADMVEAIAAARVSITLETYLFWSGKVADTFVAALSERARAGIPVKLLFDADGSRYLRRNTILALQAAGCEVRFFRPFAWSQP